ncbi:MAG: YraN family protein [Candidatus Fermentithermobacillus carboniphilus]|uniref:YraN family protein n=1 Tax=Candidatus Fermentithermobacillus carboniphilus TaxID=3085328 RepID=A0AAT9LCA4_9FIRM|nr:MAG: YraN family protein [Candidatus Fermentithermobacillus carboniphilus]
MLRHSRTKIASGVSKTRRRSPRELGFQLEQQACRYLEQNGYRVLCRNFVSRYGEIDIVALEGHLSSLLR